MPASPDLADLVKAMVVRISALESLIAKHDAQLAERDAQLAERDAQLAEHEAQLLERDVKLAELEAKIEKLTKTIEVLTEERDRNSSNSNLPPSSDGPGGGVSAGGRLRGRSGRKRGGQKGHKGSSRSLLPVRSVDKLIPLFPAVCEECSAALLPIRDDAPRRFQRVDIVGYRRHVTEWQLHEVTCEHCGHRTSDEYDPAVIPVQTFGAGLVAVVAIMTGDYRLSRRNAQRMLDEHFGIVVSLGSITAMEKRVSKALAPVHVKIHERVRAAAVQYTDATTWTRQGKLKSVLVLASKEATAFFIREDGSRKTIEPLFCPNVGILVSDRASVFTFWRMHLRQICWAHIIRKFVSFAQREGPAGRIGKDLLTMAALVFDNWHAFLDEKFDRKELQARCSPIESALTALLKRTIAAQIERLSGSCKNLLEHADALWTFVVHEGVGPTNNHAERELRSFVLWRKVSFGSQSEGGDRFAERMRSVVHTARKLGRSASAFIVDAVASCFAGQPVPGLLEPA